MYKIKYITTTIVLSSLIWTVFDPQINTLGAKMHLSLALIAILCQYFFNESSIKLKKVYRNEKKYKSKYGDITFQYPDDLSEESIKYIDEKIKEFVNKSKQ